MVFFYRPNGKDFCPPTTIIDRRNLTLTLNTTLTLTQTLSITLKFGGNRMYIFTQQDKIVHTQS